MSSTRKTTEHPNSPKKLQHEGAEAAEAVQQPAAEAVQQPAAEAVQHEAAEVAQSYEGAEAAAAEAAEAAAAEDPAGYGRAGAGFLSANLCLSRRTPWRTRQLDADQQSTTE
jgi:hypothetical protein